MDETAAAVADLDHESKPLLPQVLQNQNSFLATTESSFSSSSSSSLRSPSTGVELEGGSGSGPEIKTDGVLSSSSSSSSPAATRIEIATQVELSAWFRLIVFFAATVVAGGIIPGQNVYSRLFCEKAGLFSYACRDDTNNYYDIDERVLFDGLQSNSGSSSSSSTTTTTTHTTSSCCSAQWLLLANTMNGLSVLIYIFFFLAGLLFDSIGGQYAAIYGCVMNAGGFFVLSGLFYVLEQATSTMKSSLLVPPWMETSIFVAGVILVDAGSICTNISFYGFLWHLPTHQALILSLANCCLNVAALIPLVLRYIMDHYYDTTTTDSSSSSALSTVIGLYAGVILIVITPLCWYTVPSVDQYRAKAMDVLGVPIPRRAIKGGIKGAIKMTKVAIRILQVHTRLHCYTMIACLFTWLVAFIYMTMADPLGSEIFSNENNNNNNNNQTVTTGAGNNNGDNDAAGEHFGTLYNQMNALLGLFVGPVVGVIVDRISHPATGMQYLLWGMMLTMLTISLVCYVPNWSAQTIAVSSAALCQIVTLLFVNRYAVVFAPPNRVGAVSGALVAILGITTFIPLILFSVIITVYGSYVKPLTVLALIGTVWLMYLIYTHYTNQFPDSPIFLPEDEFETAKMFGVATLDDAAYVAGKTPEEFRRLSSSSKVSDQRTLIDAAFTAQAGERVITVARRRSSAEVSKRQSISSIQRRRSSRMSSISGGSSSLRISANTQDELFATIDGMDDMDGNDNELLSNEPPQHPIPTELTSGYVERFHENYVIQRGSAESSTDTIVMSFNGHGGYGGRSEPTIEWMLSAIGPPDNSVRITACHSIFDPMAHCAESYGTILNVRVGGENTNNDDEETAAACLCFHPDALEKGKIMETGSDRYYYSLTRSGAPPAYLNREACGEKMIQRFVGFMQDNQWDTKRQEYGPMWYIAILGTNPKYQGRGYAKKLLSVIFSWADRDKVDAYLECSKENVPYYEKNGFINTSKGEVIVDGSKMYNFIMVRKYKSGE